MAKNSAKSDIHHVPNKKKYRRIAIDSDSDSSDDDATNNAAKAADPTEFKLRRDIGTPFLEPILVRVKDLQPEAVLNVREQIDSCELVGEIKWKNIDQAEYVPIKVLHLKCPALLIDFYEKRTFWREGDTLEKVHKDV